MTLRWALRSSRVAALAVAIAVLTPLVCTASGICPMVFDDENDVIGGKSKGISVLGDKTVTLYWAMVLCDSLGEPLLYCVDTLGTVVPAGENCPESCLETETPRPLPIDERDIPGFGGYRVWSREVWRLDEFDMAREYIYGEDDTLAAGYWSFQPFYVDSIKAYTASVQNAFPYEFSVTAFMSGVAESVNYDCLEANRTGILYPLEGVKSNLSNVQVIPNPYRASADWEYGGQRRVTFIGLPSTATIRIYTVAADLVRTLEHADPESDQEFWDLRTKNGDEVAPGVYIWAVEADVPGDSSETVTLTAQGRLLVIK
jgi:hypothetical protein